MGKEKKIEWNEKLWRECYKKGGIGICMSPDWLLRGCPKCGNTSWSVTKDYWAYCEKCSIGIPTDFAFTKSGELISSLSPKN